MAKDIFIKYKSNIIYYILKLNNYIAYNTTI
jgi:hypothetical protein